MKDKIVWKVVSTVEDNFVSSFFARIPGEYVRYYKVGKKTTAKIGELFVFRTLKAAKYFAEHCRGEIILRCKTKDEIHKAEWMLACYNLWSSKIKAFWRKGSRVRGGIYGNDMAPANSYTVKSLTPLEVAPR